MTAPIETLHNSATSTSEFDDVSMAQPNATVRQRRPSQAMRITFGLVLRVVSYAWLLIALLLLWEWHMRNNPSLFIPRPTEICSRFLDVWFTSDPTTLFMSDEFRHHVGASLGRWLLGFVAASVGGVLLGSFLARHQRPNWMFQPLIRLAQSTPSIMLLPLAIILIGINDTMTTSVIVYGSFWPVLVNTIDGVSSVDRATLNSAQALRIRGFNLYRKVLLPGASKQILAGLRVALGVSIILMVGSELYASSEGVGYYILLAQRTLRFTDMFAGIMLSALIGVFANVVFFLAERRLMRWQPKSKED